MVLGEIDRVIRDTERQCRRRVDFVVIPADRAIALLNEMSTVMLSWDAEAPDWRSPTRRFVEGDVSVHGRRVYLGRKYGAGFNQEVP